MKLKIWVVLGLLVLPIALSSIPFREAVAVNWLGVRSLFFIVDSHMRLSQPINSVAPLPVPVRLPRRGLVYLASVAATYGDVDRAIAYLHQSTQAPESRDVGWLQLADLYYEIGDSEALRISS